MKIRHMDDATFQKIRKMKKIRRGNDHKVFKDERREQREFKQTFIRFAM